ncbi:hypothetical protein KUL42_36490 [Alteromonas sp. KUL42]|nr:DUF1800 domain-containing protein [Alteromonas sp. KUL42]GEA08888.1 hypothetical protein KUL42_36490 [Alteromonas sp. KUL42]
MHLRLLSFLHYVLMLLALMSLSQLHAAPFQATFVDDANNQPIENVSVVAKRVLDDGTFAWAQRRTTDSLGNAVFDLSFEDDQTYVFELKAFNNFRARLGDFTEAQDRTWRVGKALFSILDGTSEDKSGLSQYRVQLQQQLSDGTFKGITTLTTDTNGQLKLDLPQGVFRFRAKSPLSTQWIASDTFEHTNPIEFVVGERPVDLKLIHAQTGQPIANQEVKAWRQLGDGKQWLGRKTTDSDGYIKWEMRGLEKGDTFVLATDYFGTRDATIIITEAGEKNWQIGKYFVTVKNGSQTPVTALDNYNITLFRQDGEQSTRIKSMQTDDRGQLLFDINEDTANKSYLLRAVSPSDNKTRYEFSFTSFGPHIFTVGTTPITATLSHARTNALFADERVWLARWSETENKFKRFRSAKTNELGEVAFDVDEMDGETKYRLEARPLSNFTIFSSPFTQAEHFALKAGNVKVTLKDGSLNNLPTLGDYAVQIGLISIDTNRYKYYGSAITNSAGILELDLPTPPDGKQYVVRAKSPTNNAWRSSDIINTAGDYEFVVGNPAVNVTVRDANTNSMASGLWVTAQTQNSDGHWVNTVGRRTDDTGTAVFDLDGITHKREYRFKTRKYRGNVISEIISSPGNVDLEVGSLPVTLVNNDTGSALANVRINAFAYENEKLSWRSSGTTNANGEVVFDVPELGIATYVLRAEQPLASVRRIYSPFIQEAGNFEFAVSANDNTALDNEAPVIFIHAPETDEIADEGFILSGNAQDNHQLASVKIQVWDYSNNIHEFAVTPSQNGAWSSFIPAQWLQAGEQIGIAATAYDRMGNWATANRFLHIVDDDNAPRIRILSHANNDIVSTSGFSIFGDVSDDIHVQSLSITVTDTNTGSLLFEEPVRFNSQSGQWAFFLNENIIVNSDSLEMVLSAVDSSNNHSSTNLQLLTKVVQPSVQQLVKRATFGATPTLANEITQVGVNTWIEQQLAPEMIDDDELESMLSELPIESINDLRKRELMYQIYSKRQLQQVMAWFWENHFSTDFNRHRKVAYEERENSAFRTHALGKFSDLLEISAKSPAMLKYLDNVSSRAGRINENYAREVMELHTLGVNGGYTDDDIISLARILTGWHIAEGEFTFSANRHDNDNKLFLNEQVVAGGVEEGEATLARLSQHPSTAMFICGKLIQFWIGEGNYPTLQRSCAAGYISSEGDIPTLLRIIFHSNAFNIEDNIGSKIKTPLQVYTSAIRATQAEPDFNEALRILKAMGMQLFTYPAPDGFSDKGADWINVDAMVQRTKFALRFALKQDGGEVDLLTHLEAQGYTTATAIVEYLFNLLLDTQYTALQRQQALAILNERDAFDMQDNDAPIKLKRLLATLLAYPGFQYQ